MFKKNKKQTETIKEPKEKKVRTVKVGTHKKTVIALWVVLIASVSFGVYKNFTAIDQHTTHEKEIIELRLQDTNGIENFVKNFAKSYYTWDNSKERKRQSPACPTSSVAWCRNSSPDRRDAWKSRNSVRKISLTNVWSFKRHKKQPIL